MLRILGFWLLVVASLLFVASFVQFYIGIWTGSASAGASGFITLLFSIAVAIGGAVVVSIGGED